MRFVTTALLCPLLLSAPAFPEQDSDTARILAGLSEKTREYVEERGAREADLRRRLEVLDRLLEGEGTITLQGGELRLADVRRKLEEARGVAGHPYALTTPVPAVLDALEQLLARPPFGATPEKLRSLISRELAPLEANAVELEESLSKDAYAASFAGDALRQLESRLRNVSLGAIRMSIEARRAALGLRLSLRQPQPPRPPARMPFPPFDLRSHLAAYQEDVAAREYDLAWKVEILFLLIQGGDSISPEAPLLQVTNAVHGLEEAEARAARSVPMEEPVRGVLARLRQLLSSPPFGMTPRQVRDHYFHLVTPLEENLLQTAAGFRAEGAAPVAIAAGLLQLEANLRSATLEGLRTSIEARRLELGSGAAPDRRK